MSNPEGAPARRRIEHESDRPREKRSGCLIWGAVLGVVVGGMFAAYGLKPILRHYYGEKHISADEAYSGDGKLVRVDRVEDSAERGVTVVEITVVSAKPWEPEASDFSVEYRGVKDWQEGVRIALAASDAELSGSLPQREEVRLRLEFPRPAAGQTAEYLHLADPRVRFELSP